MSFCAHLRRRPSCLHLIPVLLNSDIPLRENNLKSHDIAVPIPSNDASHRSYRVLIVTPSSTAPANKNATLARVQQFERLSGGVDSAIFFCPPTPDGLNHITDPHQSFQDVQFHLVSNGIFLPVFYITKPESIPEALKTLTAPSQTPLKEPQLPNPAISVLPYCSTQPPMTQQSLTILSDMYPSLRAMSSIQTDATIQERMEAAGMCKEAEACSEFWKMEYLAE